MLFRNQKTILFLFFLSLLFASVSESQVMEIFDVIFDEKVSRKIHTEIKKDLTELANI